MKNALILTLMLLAAAAPGMAQEDAGLDTELKKVNYIIGHGMAQNIKQFRIELDEKAFLRGVKDTLEGKKPLIDETTMQTIMLAYQQKVRAEIEKEQAELEVKRAGEIPANKKMIEEFSGDGSIPTTASGLKYRMVREGDGAAPVSSDRVEVHYKGMLVDGTVFDSSYDRDEPSKFGLGQVIPGWGEALQLMKAGGKLQVLIPGNMAYGPNPPPGSKIPPNAVLFFEIELLGVL